MAKCDEGYRCEVCGQDVEGLSDSDLYLRYVIGLAEPEILHTAQERHIRCNPALGQFIVHPDFPPLTCMQTFDKRQLDPVFVHDRESLVTRGWLRLRELEGRAEISLLEYPLPEAQARYRHADL